MQKNENKFVLPIIVTIVLLVVIPTSVYALQTDTEYFIESENAFIVIRANTNSELIDIGFAVNGEWIFVTDKNITISRNEADSQSGRFFGYTDSGDAFYLKYSIQDENAKLLVKTWQDNLTMRIVEEATVDYLFS